MPQISFFYGIYIWMNFSDHQPPHFHAWYGEYKAIVNIKDGIVKGEMPGRALRMILEWLDDHRDELMANWEKAQKGEPLDKIEPLMLFNNGERRIVDLRDSLKGTVFAPLKNIDYFKRFSIKFNTVEWDNGADFAPEYLYDLSTAS